MYSNPITSTKNGVSITVCKADDARCATRIRCIANVEAAPRVSAHLTVSRESRGRGYTAAPLDTYEVRYRVGTKSYLVKRIATETEALAIGTSRFAKAVARLEGHVRHTQKRAAGA